MAKPFQTNRPQFDSDLDAILDRVYGNKPDAPVDIPRAVIPQTFVRNDQGSKELKEALSDLRSRRERAQSTMRLQEEIDYLRTQINTLRDLGDQIERLRLDVQHGRIALDLPAD